MLSILIITVLLSAAQPQPSEQPEGQCLLGYVFFGSGSARLDASARKILDVARKHPVRSMHTENGVRFLIYASTDTAGSEQFNLQLSRERGQAVRQYLRSLGIRPDRITVVAEGEMPISGSPTGVPSDQARRAFVMVDAPPETWARYLPGVMC